MKKFNIPASIKTSIRQLLTLPVRIVAGCVLLLLILFCDLSNDGSSASVSKSGLANDYNSSSEFPFLRIINSTKNPECAQILFTGTPLDGFNMSADYWTHKPAFMRALSDTFTGYRINPYALIGHSGRVEIQTRLLHYLASRPWVHTVCETGFNAGHSAFTFLSANRNLVVHSFDTLERPYMLPMAKTVDALFPERFTLHSGDSKITVPQFVASSPGTRCNLIFVDGGHDYMHGLADLINLASIADVDGNGTIVVFDDYVTDSMDRLSEAWNDGKRWGYVQEVAACRIAQQLPTLHSLGFVFGKVVKRHS